MKSIIRISSFFLIILLYSCSQKSNDTPKSKEDFQYQIIPKDSITVNNIIANLFLFQNANGEHLFFRDAGASKVFVFDREGNLQYEWSKTGDVPGGFSMIADNLSISAEGQIVISDNLSGIRIFSPEGDLVLQQRIYQPQTSIHAGVDIFRKNQVVKKNGAPYLLHHLDLMDDNQEVDAAFFQNRKNLLLTDLKERETEKILPFPEGSKFLSGKAFPFEDFRPNFYYVEEEGKLYLMFQNEPVVYIYQWENEAPELIESIRLDLEGFYEHEGWDYAAVRYGLLSGGQLESPFPSAIKSLEKVGDGLLIHYRPGPDPSELSEWQSYKSGKADEALTKRLSEKAKEKTVFFKDGEKYDVVLPPMHYDSYRVIGDEIWWMKPLSKDKEDESYTIYTGNLKEIL